MGMVRSNSISQKRGPTSRPSFFIPLIWPFYVSFLNRESNKYCESSSILCKFKG